MTATKLIILGYLVATVLPPIAHSANILDLMGCASPSHHIWHSALVNALAAKGHNVTILSTDVDKNAPPNVHYVHMEGVYDYMYKEIQVDLVALHKETPKESVLTLNAFGTVSCLGIMKSKGLQQMLRYPDDFKFDLIIYDFTLGPCILGFLHKFKYPPMVGVTAFNIPSYTVEIVGGHNYYAYIPYFALNYDTDMNFFQRLYNIYIYAYDYIQRNYVYVPSINEMAKQVFGKDYPYMGDLELKTTIALVNSHPAIDFPEPLAPNVIPVGGLQVKDPKPLPLEIERFINASQKGAVLFSLGTNVRSDKLGADKQKMLLEAFAQMPDYHFLWKFESETLPMKLPKNVLIKPWLPQNDILGHCNVKAFITHAGTLSTHEATWHGVPMIAIPFFVDQVRNSYKSIRAGVSERILFESLTTPLVVQKVRKVLEDPSYREKMKIRSARFRDQPEKPLVRAVWWIEYILRNPNPDHLRSPVLKLGAFVSNLYDIILFFVIVIALMVFALWKYLIRRLLSIYQRNVQKIKKH